MITEAKVKMSINGHVRLDLLDAENFLLAEDAHDLAVDLLEAAYQSRALKLVDDVMAKHRGRYVEDLLEYRVLDEAWRDLRLALGYDDSPTGGAL